MGDHRAVTGGTGNAPPTGKRVARHASEKVPSEPYTGRRIARPAAQPAQPPAGDPVVPPLAETVQITATLPVRVPAPAADDFHVTAPLPVEASVSRLGEMPTTRPVAAPVLAAVQVPVALQVPVDLPIEVPIEAATLAPLRASRTAPRATGRRVATRRSPLPGLLSAPVLIGVAVLGVSVAGALQATHPGLADAAPHHLSPASALSGSSAVGSASLLGGRATVISRDSNRQTLSQATGSSLQAAADAQAKQRDAALSQLRGLAEQQAARIKLHQWVLPVQAGVYHLTARFGDYSSLWSHFHTGLDFAAPTGTPIMAVAGGTISEVGYSGAYGNRTVETLPDGTELWYCHQNEFGTSVGATVRPGQVIGYVGSTGNVTGPHLHLEVHPGGGDPVDPFTALEVHGLHP
jgi:murein DD-endopeptidase MepM/ murein hydrolase activator NlpD